MKVLQNPSTRLSVGQDLARTCPLIIPLPQALAVLAWDMMPAGGSEHLELPRVSF